MEKAVDLLQDLVAELNLDCDYEHPGFLRVATTRTYRRRILEEIELAHRLGLEGIHWLEKDQLDRQVKSDMYLGALVGTPLRHPQPGQTGLELAGCAGAHGGADL